MWFWGWGGGGGWGQVKVVHGFDFRVWGGEWGWVGCCVVRLKKEGTASGCGGGRGEDVAPTQFLRDPTKIQNNIKDTINYPLKKLPLVQ